MSEQPNVPVPHWKGKGYSFFCNQACEYFPCHPTDDPENFNCLFCYCPLYTMGPDCGGNYSYTKQGIKNCSDCTLPHLRDNYGYIIAQFRAITQRMSEEHKARVQDNTP